MKRHLLLSILCATLLWSFSSNAGVCPPDDPGSNNNPGELGETCGFNDNPHNLSSRSENSSYKATNETQICIFCHVPHGASPQSSLWGRPNPMGPPGGFPLFNSANVKDPGLNLGVDDTNLINPSDPSMLTVVENTLYSKAYEYPNGASKLCLSCHDGVTAIGILANGTEIIMNTDNISGAAKIDLAISHPISFVYTEAVETYLNTVAASKFYDFQYYSGSKAIPLDGQSRIQCTICHEPHLDTKTASYPLPFWRMKDKSIEKTAAADYEFTCTQCHETTYYTYPQVPPTNTLHKLNL